METTRVDRWMWAVRMFRSRTAATTACRGGHVKIDGRSVDPAHLVRIGDQVQIVSHRERLLEVTAIIDRRVSATVAATCFVDHTPAPTHRDAMMSPPGLRPASSGRPTKKDRRAIDRLRQR